MMLGNLPPATDPLVRRVAECVRNQELLDPGASVLLAVSGGADSVALALVFHALAAELHLSLRIAHIHHGLRGREADEDARWVAEFAAALDIPCDVVHVDVPALKEKERGSIEDIARTARYR
ncbi:MAG TPA: ATP-binding protein, partial [Candidatus Latescibacteria bacterium]|nr:ATP-binding protein [Candidatus Latescibacterota bacterium]